MSVVSLDILGFRGFSHEQTLCFAQPNGKTGSGLTILVGPNNGGKSTIIESLQALSTGISDSPSFTEGQRNKLAKDRVLIRSKSKSGVTIELGTISSGGFRTDRKLGGTNMVPCWYVLPSRRFFNPSFNEVGNVMRDRHDYTIRLQALNTRSAPINDFSSFRLFAALNRKEEFNSVLKRVIDPVPDWTIDQSDGKTCYLKVNSGGQFHNSDGLGEGLVNLLFLVDSLYDSSPDDFIAIDEPELSLHPAFQRRLVRLFAD